MKQENDVEESSDIASENEYDEAENSNHEQDDEKHPHGDGDGATQAKKPKLDPKDPLRPRRKKARRACFACQRAHLTCGMLILSFIPWQHYVANISCFGLPTSQITYFLPPIMVVSQNTIRYRLTCEI